MVTATTEGHIRIWNIDVRYKLSEDPKLKVSFSTPYESLQLVAFGGKEEKGFPTVVAATHHRDIVLYSLDGQVSVHTALACLHLYSS